MTLKHIFSFFNNFLILFLVSPVILQKLNNEDSKSLFIGDVTTVSLEFCSDDVFKTMTVADFETTVSLDSSSTFTVLTDSTMSITMYNDDFVVSKKSEDETVIIVTDANGLPTTKTYNIISSTTVVTTDSMMNTITISDIVLESGASFLEIQDGSTTELTPSIGDKITITLTDDVVETKVVQFKGYKTSYTTIFGDVESEVLTLVQDGTSTLEIDEDGYIKTNDNPVIMTSIETTDSNGVETTDYYTIEDVTVITITDEFNNVAEETQSIIASGSSTLELIQNDESIKTIDDGTIKTTIQVTDEFGIETSEVYTIEEIQTITITETDNLVVTKIETIMESGSSTVKIIESNGLKETIDVVMVATIDESGSETNDYFTIQDIITTSTTDYQNNVVTRTETILESEFLTVEIIESNGSKETIDDPIIKTSIITTDDSGEETTEVYTIQEIQTTIDFDSPNNVETKTETILESGSSTVEIVESSGSKETINNLTIITTIKTTDDSGKETMEVYTIQEIKTTIDFDSQNNVETKTETILESGSSIVEIVESSGSTETIDDVVMVTTTDDSGLETSDYFTIEEVITTTTTDSQNNVLTKTETILESGSSTVEIVQSNNSTETIDDLIVKTTITLTDDSGIETSEVYTIDEIKTTTVIDSQNIVVTETQTILQSGSSTIEVIEFNGSTETIDDVVEVTGTDDSGLVTSDYFTIQNIITTTTTDSQNNVVTKTETILESDSSTIELLGFNGSTKTIDDPIIKTTIITTDENGQTTSNEFTIKDISTYTTKDSFGDIVTETELELVSGSSRLEVTASSGIIKPTSSLAVGDITTVYLDGCPEDLTKTMTVADFETTTPLNGLNSQKLVLTIVEDPTTTLTMYRDELVVPKTKIEEVSIGQTTTMIVTGSDGQTTKETYNIISTSDVLTTNSMGNTIRTSNIVMESGASFVKIGPDGSLTEVTPTTGQQITLQNGLSTEVVVVEGFETTYITSSGKVKGEVVTLVQKGSTILELDEDGKTEIYSPGIMETITVEIDGCPDDTTKVLTIFSSDLMGRTVVYDENTTLILNSYGDILEPTIIGSMSSIVLTDNGKSDTIYATIADIFQSDPNDLVTSTVLQEGSSFYIIEGNNTEAHTFFTDNNIKPTKILSSTTIKDNKTIGILDSTTVTIDVNGNTVFTTTEIISEKTVTETLSLQPTVTFTKGITQTDSVEELTLPPIIEDYINLSEDQEIYQNMNSEYSLTLNYTNEKKCPFDKDNLYYQQINIPVLNTGFGLLWHQKQNSLIFTDKFGEQIFKFVPETGQTVFAAIDGNELSAIIPTTIDNEYVLVVDNKIIIVELTFEKDVLVVKYKKLLVVFESAIELSVARLDSKGRLWLAVRWNNGDLIREYLYMISDKQGFIKERTLLRMGDIAWNDKVCYITDIESRIVYIYNYDENTGDLTKRKVLYDFKTNLDYLGSPYGIAIDNKNNLWLTLFGTGKVINFNPTTTQILNSISIPNKNLVSLTFGELKLDRLFVTSAHDEENRKLPYLYAVGNTGVSGKHKKEVFLKTSKIFGENIIKITEENAKPVLHQHNYLYPECKINKDQLKINVKSDNSCGFSKLSPVLQIVPPIIKTYGSSVHYEKKTGSVYFADVFQPVLNRYEIESGKTYTVRLKDITTATAVIPIKNSNRKFVVTEDDQIVVFENRFNENQEDVNPKKKIIAKLEQASVKQIFSVGKTDSRGRLWVGTKFVTLGPKKSNKLYSLIKNSLVVAADGFTSCGGMTWSTDLNKMYFADMGEREIYQFKFDEDSGKISERETIFNIKGTTFTNFTISDIITDNQNQIWAAVYGGAAVIRINPENSQIIEMIGIPSKYPTGLEFVNGEERNMLLVVSESEDFCDKIDGIGYTYLISNLGGVAAGRVEDDFFVY